MARPDMRALARAGGAGLLSAPASARESAASMRQALLAGGSTDRADGDLLLRTVRAAGIRVCVVPVEVGAAACRGPGLVVLAPPRFVAGDWPAFAGQTRSRSEMDIDLSLVPTPRMSSVGDEVMPIVMTTSDRHGTRDGPVHALTSDTTRRAGLVSVDDVAPTILDYLGVPVPAQMDGSPIRVTDDPAPFALHQRHLEQRHIRLPIQLAALLFVCLPGASAIVALVLMGRGRSASPRVAAALRFGVLCGVAILIPLAAGGWLPHLTYPWAVSWIVGWTAVLAFAAWLIPLPGRMASLSFLGAVALTYLAVDLALGSRGLRVPLLGGTMFDGSRFYGLPNAFESTLLASGLFVAARFDPVRGSVVLFACGLLAGFPGLGADVGGSIVLFAAAGLWWQLRSRGRLGIRELAAAAAVTVAGLAIVLVVSRFLAPSPTHVTRFVERSGSSLTSGLDEIRHRLAAGVHQVVHAPASLIALLGLPVVLWAGIRGGPVAGALAAVPPWRDVVIVLVLCAGVAFFVNDTGMAAAAPSFLYAVAVLAFAALSPPATRRREATGEGNPSVPAG